MNILECRNYSDWFGDGNTNNDVVVAIQKHGKPLRIFYECGGRMAALVYRGKIVCVGYDGFEYRHEFVMSDRVDDKTMRKELFARVDK